MSKLESDIVNASAFSSLKDRFFCDAYHLFASSTALFEKSTANKDLGSAYFAIQEAPPPLPEPTSKTSLFDKSTSLIFWWYS